MRVTKPIIIKIYGTEDSISEFQRDFPKTIGSEYIDFLTISSPKLDLDSISSSIGKTFSKFIFHFLIKNDDLLMYFDSDNMFKLDSVEKRFKKSNFKIIYDKIISFPELIDLISICILAGGKGERLKSISEDIPKPLINVNNTPIIRHVISTFSTFGFKNFHFSLGYKGNLIKNYLEHNNPENLSFSYSYEETPLGTGGGLLLCKDKLTDIFIMSYADLILNINPLNILLCHLISESNVTLTLHNSNHPEDSDIILMDSNSIVEKIIHRPGNKNFGDLTNGGVYVFNKCIFDESLFQKGDIFNLDTDFLPKIIASRKISGFLTKSYLKDIGTPKRLNEADSEVKQ